LANHQELGPSATNLPDEVGQSELMVNKLSDLFQLEGGEDEDLFQLVVVDGWSFQTVAMLEVIDGLVEVNEV